jgi:CRP-like cAMP-binding protein
MMAYDNRILELIDRIVSMVDVTITSDVVLRDAVKICEFLRTANLFQHLTPAELTNIAEKMKHHRYNKGEIIIKEQEPGEAFFLIGHGTVGARRRGMECEERLVANLGVGNCFGEHALVIDAPRNATYVATSDRVEVFTLDKANLKYALDISASFKDQIQAIYFQRQ